jgi:hypothetical protein
MLQCRIVTFFKLSDFSNDPNIKFCMETDYKCILLYNLCRNHFYALTTTNIMITLRVLEIVFDKCNAIRTWTIERIVLLDFIHRLVSQEQTKLRNQKYRQNTTIHTSTKITQGSITVKCAVAGSLIATCVWLTSRVYVCVRPGKLLCG